MDDDDFDWPAKIADRLAAYIGDRAQNETPLTGGDLAIQGLRPDFVILDEVYSGGRSFGKTLSMERLRSPWTIVGRPPLDRPTQAALRVVEAAAERAELGAAAARHRALKALLTPNQPAPEFGDLAIGGRNG